MGLQRRQQTSLCSGPMGQAIGTNGPLGRNAMNTARRAGIDVAYIRHVRGRCPRVRIRTHRALGRDNGDLRFRPNGQRCEVFVLESVNPVNVGWDQRATRAPAHRGVADTWWAGAAYQPLVPPYDSGTNEYTGKNTSQRCPTGQQFK